MFRLAPSLPGVQACQRPIGGRLLKHLLPSNCFPYPQSVFVKHRFLVVADVSRRFWAVLNRKPPHVGAFNFQTGSQSQLRESSGQPVPIPPDYDRKTAGLCPIRLFIVEFSLWQSQRRWGRKELGGVLAAGKTRHLTCLCPRPAPMRSDLLRRRCRGGCLKLGGGSSRTTARGNSFFRNCGSDIC